MLTHNKNEQDMLPLWGYAACPVPKEERGHSSPLPSDPNCPETTTYLTAGRGQGDKNRLLQELPSFLCSLLVYNPNQMCCTFSTCYSCVSSTQSTVCA